MIKQLAVAAAALTIGLAVTIAGEARGQGLPTAREVRADRDYGSGRGGSSDWLGQDGPMAVARGGAQAAVGGQFGPVISMPLIPLHAVLLPDGRVFSYGSGPVGEQTGQFLYDIWDPALGTGPAAHWVLPNTTAVDIFCSAQILLPSGGVLISGGDLTINGQRNRSNDKVVLFDGATNSVQAGPKMFYKRWYPSLTPLRDGRVLALGGRQNYALPTPTPEILGPDGTWQVLPGAVSDQAYGALADAWWYPRAFEAANGRVVVLTPTGAIYGVDPNGSGTVSKYAAVAPGGDYTMPNVQYAPGKVLALRGKQKVSTLDLNGPEPVVTAGKPISQIRSWSSTTVLADGRVLVTGGSSASNALRGIANHVEIWDPATGLWTRGAEAVKPRLYHSIGLLLPDATVLVGGGGAPGPIRELNAEIYHPPYLYKRDGSGEPAPRPTLASAPNDLTPGVPFALVVDAATPVSRVTLVRAGSVTHSMGLDQRLLELPFAAVTPDLMGGQPSATQPVLVTPTADAVAMPPGYYLLFAFDAAGVPSAAKIVKVLPPAVIQAAAR